MMTSSVPLRLAILDLDGTTGQSRRTASCMPTPPDDLIYAIRKMGQAGIKFIVVTGQPQKYGLAGARLLGNAEFCLGVASEYGGWELSDSEGRDGIQLRDPEVAERETAAFERHKAALRELVVQTGGEPDDTAVSFVSAYWSDADSFNAAKARANLFNALIGDDSMNLRFRWSDGDHSMACIQRSVSKACIVEYLRSQGHEIVLAAGDTESDIPTLAAARFAILCTEHDQHSDALKVEFAQRIQDGTAVLAPAMHGHGLAACIRYALDEGKLG